MIRPPAVAGYFYPGHRSALETEVASLLRGAIERLAESPERAAPRAMIVPHAGYRYSGAIAALAYASLSRFPGRWRRALLLGPAHRVYLDDMALPTARAFATPLGELTIDAELSAELVELAGVACADRPHAEEHALEVQLPFLQHVFGDIAIVPLVVGHAGADAVSRVIEAGIAHDDVLVLVSSDLSHYLDYRTAQRHDAATRDAILALRATLRPEDACGCHPVNGLLVAARRLGLSPRLLAQCNSGDTAGSRDQVVGYASFVFDSPEQREGTRASP